tara:strand:+ start:296 stop:730 length:435 start_codon:yes stop_codon:yes gene_type:complete
MAAKKKETGKGLYKRRYATLKEHRAAVAARKNIGPVKSGAEYARKLTKGKSAPTPKSAQAPKKEQTAKPKQTSKSEAASRFYRSSSGTRGQLRPSNPASPTVRRKGSTTGASVDPRERSLRKNRADARRSARRRLRVNRRGRRV